MSDSKAPAIRARLRYANVAEFKAGYAKFVSTGGMFIPVPESKLKPVGSDIRFQFMLNNGETVLLGKGNVLQVRRPDPNTPNSPVGILVKFSKLSQDSKKIIDEMVAEKDNQKVPTQEVIVDEEEIEERENYPTPAALEVVQKVADISSDNTVVATLDDIFRSRGSSLDETTPTPEQIGERLLTPSFDSPVVSASSQTVEAKIVPDDFLFKAHEDLPAEPELDLAPEPELDLAPAPKPVPAKKPVSNIRVLSYDDMTAVDAASVDFGFSGEESEIDDMFDDLFGKSGDSSFFEEVLGGTRAAKEPEAPAIEAAPVETPEPVAVAEIPVSEPELPVLTIDDEPLPIDSDPEMPAFGSDAIAPAQKPVFEDSDSEMFLDDPVFSDDDLILAEPFADVASPDDSLSMEDAFESEPEDELFNSLNSESDPIIGDSASDPLDRINEVYESEDENPFRADPPSIEMELDIGPLVEQEDDDEPDSLNAISADNGPESLPQIPDLNEGNPESSVVEFDLEPDASEVAFESFDSQEEAQPTRPETFEHDISRGGELDGLLGNLENDAPLDRSFDFSHDADIVAPTELNEDSDSLEALLALANKDIESKKEEEKEEVDILDQLLGDDALPPLPDVSSSFTMPSPESAGKKKGLFSKLFGKD